MKIKYFAWVRERIGKGEEILDPPPTVRTVGELVWIGDIPALRPIPTDQKETNP